MAIAALLIDKHKLAENYWGIAMDEYEKHFDTLVNFNLYKWRNAMITDQVLLQNLKPNVFLNKQKGGSIEGIINIAIGEKEKGLQILEQFNNQKK